MSGSDKPTPARRNPVQPKKLLLSKWTAVQPQQREKHFLVREVELPEPPSAPVQWVLLEAVHAGRVQRLAWRELRDASQWRQGWV